MGAGAQGSRAPSGRTRAPRLYFICDSSWQDFEPFCQK
jgi:hypothetical protein